MKDFDKFNSDMVKISQRSEKVITAKLYNAALLVQGEAVKSIQKQSFGRSVTRYTPAGNPYTHVAAPEGSPPNTDTGNLVKNIIAQKRGNDVVVGSSAAAPYGKWLEVGNERGQKWEWLKPAFEKKLPQIRQILKGVAAELIRGK